MRLIALTFCLLGCSSVPKPFLTPGDIQVMSQQKLTETQVNDIMTRIVSQFAVPRRYNNIAVDTARGGKKRDLDANTLLCAEGVKSFKKSQADKSITIELEYDAATCYQKVVAAAKPTNRKKMQRLMVVRKMGSRVFFESKCVVSRGFDIGNVSLKSMLGQGNELENICENAKNQKFRVHYELALDLILLGQPTTSTARVMVENKDGGSCRFKTDAQLNFNSDGCQMFMGITNNQQRTGTFALSLESVNIMGNLNEPYFTHGHYAVTLNNWVGKVVFDPRKRPAWKLKRGDQIATGSIDLAPGLTH